MTTPVGSLMAAFSLIDDPRKPRGVRHPFDSILTLAFLGLPCRQTDFVALARWAEVHWSILRRPLGFSRRKPPHAGTISRVVARFSLEQFREAFAKWLNSLPKIAQASVAAVDDKASKQGRDPRRECVLSVGQPKGHRLAHGFGPGFGLHDRSSEFVGRRRDRRLGEPPPLPRQFPDDVEGLAPLLRLEAVDREDDLVNRFALPRRASGNVTARQKPTPETPNFPALLQTVVSYPEDEPPGEPRSN